MIPAQTLDTAPHQPTAPWSCVQDLDLGVVTGGLGQSWKLLLGLAKGLQYP